MSLESPHNNFGNPEGTAQCEKRGIRKEILGFLIEIGGQK